MDALSAGRPYPLGAHADAGGVNFALFSSAAARVELCVFAGDRLTPVPLPACTDGVWHGYLRGAKPGLEYAYRVHGRQPAWPGDRCDGSRLLLDPAARQLAGRFDWRLADAADSVYGLRCRVWQEGFDWGDDQPPATPWADTQLCEVHVRGATRTHPDVPAALRGSYAGLASAPMLEHYRRLGVTALNLLPVAQFVDEERLVALGLRNYWGYNPVNFFAPEPRYASPGGDAHDEFRAMVRTLHAAGIEVIVDVVFNHTAETDEFGPTLSLRGIDNAAYYRLRAGDPARYEDYSGCGNTLAAAHPRALQLVMDALRFWVAAMHVDGFRFDLAAVLTRDSGFLAAIAQDPLLAGVKLIAEPWDLGPDGYRLGRFPPGWSEWNDRFRDTARGFWLTGGAGVATLAAALAGSREMFGEARTPQAGINFVTAHDGFTLRDLLSYERRHNEANGEGNRDGHAHNHACNCGVEGDSDDPMVRERRARLARSLLATLYLAQGVPMLQGGDELGRTQRGNNNAYCQDNALTAFDWRQADPAWQLAAFVGGLAALRRRFRQLRRTRWLSGEAGAGGNPDCLWWHPDGRAMQLADWHASLDGLGLLLHAEAVVAAAGRNAPGAGEGEGGQRPDLGRAAAGASSLAGPGGRLLCLFNRADADRAFLLPEGEWRVACDTAAADPFAAACADAPARGARVVGWRSVCVLCDAG